MRKLLVIVALGAAAWFWRHHDTPPMSQPTPAPVGLDRFHPPEEEKAFACDGRTSCSQMTSCDEATFFLQHCPDVKMDGERDGIPCERQWCGR